jgi:DNA-binding response OmpR family regulator
VKLLVIEDDENKRQQVVSFLVETYSHVEIVQRKSYQSGLKEILEHKADAILLDMTLPTYDKSPVESGGRLRHFAGREILGQMSRKGMKTAVIVVTGFESFGEDSASLSLAEIKDELGKEFPHLYKGAVYYSSDRNQWKVELQVFLDSILKI